MKIQKMLTLLMAALFLLPLGIAQEEQMALSKPSIVMPYPGDDLTLSQNHYYTVNFDGEGEATVAAKIAIQNTHQEPLSELKLEIPGTSVRLINALQEVQTKKQRCSNWRDSPSPYSKEMYWEDLPEDQRNKCEYWYEQYEIKYYSLERAENKLSKSVQYTFTLPKPIGDQETSKIILYYKAEGYTDHGMGVFDFDFETLKLNQDINQIRVSVTVQDDLFLKGVGSEIDYRGGAMLKMTESAMAPSPAGIASDQLQSFSNQIEWAQGMVKEAQGLDPLESFHVTGRYGKSRLALYQGKIWVSAIVLLLVIGGLVFGTRKMLSSKAKASNPVLAVVGGGVVASVGMFITWVVAFVLMNAVRQMVDYQTQGMISVLIMLVSALISLTLLVGAPVLVGYRHGVMAGLMTVGVMMLVLLVLTIIAIMFFMVTSTRAGPVIMY